MDINLTVPKNWNELSQIQLENVVYHMFCYKEIVSEDNGDNSNATARLFIELGKELLRGNNKTNIKEALTEITADAMRDFTKFLYKDVDRTKFPAPIKIKNTLYHPPDQRLRNITIGEFAYADAVFFRFKSKNEKAWLSVLCAALYRESSAEKIETDTRKPFSKLSVDQRAKIFHRISIKKRLAIAAAFEGSRNHITKSFPNLFPKKEDHEDEPNPAPTKPPAYTSFREIIFEKIDGDPAKFKNTNEMLAYDFFDIVERDLKKIKNKK